MSWSIFHGDYVKTQHSTNIYMFRIVTCEHRFEAPVRKVRGRGVSGARAGRVVWAGANVGLTVGRIAGTKSDGLGMQLVAG